jgi:NAD-dependent dihydropyrimidine dehydrogenase PreA subunit
MGRFVEITIRHERLGATQALAVVRSCPVDVYELDDSGRLSTRPSQEDECILCGRCVSLVPSAIEVRRAYGARTLVSPAGGADG